MLLLLICCIFLTVMSAGLMLKIFWMRKAAEEIREGLEEILGEDTNRLLSVSSQDKAIRRLADDINTQLGELRRMRHRFTLGDLELKNAITNISHDIRTPLAAICAYLDLLETCEERDRAEEYIKIIRNRTEALRQLTEELFQYSMVIAPKKEGLREPVAVNALLEECIVGYYAALREKGITPVAHMTENRMVRRLNRKALSRVFSNLLSNAIKYSDGDLEITLSNQGEVVFANHASQLDEVRVGRLFDRFYTVEASGKSTGLGLSIARTLMEQMGGSIDASYEGGRLIVRIVLPYEEN